jgi:ATP-dependent DNA ligase
MIHTQLCQLAGDWRGDVPEGGLMAETKVDGWRCLRFAGIDGKARLWSRNGIPLDGADHVAYALDMIEKVAGEPQFIDGEIQVGGTLAATKAWFEGGYRRGGEAGTFYGFDCLTMAEWQAGGSDRPLYERKARLVALWQAVQDDPALSWEFRPGSKGDDAWRRSVTILPDLWLADAGDVMAEARRAWAQGLEGLMLKDALAPYRRSRVQTWMKVKREGAHKWRKAA